MGLIWVSLILSLTWARPWPLRWGWQPGAAAALGVTRKSLWRLLSTIRTRGQATGSMVARVLLVGPVLLASVTLPALAYLSPPDPAWIHGIYDAADHDDVVLLVTSGTGNVAPAGAADLLPVPSPGASVPPSSPSLVLALSRSAARPRAPPAA